MENNENQENNFNNSEKSKYESKHLLLIALMVFLGAFLAFYVLVHQVIIRIIPPIPKEMLRYEKKLTDDFKKLDKYTENEFQNFKNKISAIQTHKTADAYIIIVDLKKFNNNINNIRFNVSGNTISISGNTIKSPKNNNSAYYFSETFEIPEKIELSDITKEEVDNKYIITIPIEN